MNKSFIPIGAFLAGIFTIGNLPPVPNSSFRVLNTTVTNPIPIINNLAPNIIPNIEGPTLSISNIMVTNLCCFIFSPVQSEGGSGSITSEQINYTGPARKIWANGLNSGIMLIESSMDLIHWLPYPGSAQLTLIPTNNTSIITDNASMMFFRGRIVN